MTIENLVQLFEIIKKTTYGVLEFGLNQIFIYTNAKEILSEKKEQNSCINDTVLPLFLQTFTYPQFGYILSVEASEGDINSQALERKPL